MNDKDMLEDLLKEYSTVDIPSAKEVSQDDETPSVVMPENPSEQPTEDVMEDTEELAQTVEAMPTVEQTDDGETDPPAEDITPIVTADTLPTQVISLEDEQDEFDGQMTMDEFMPTAEETPSSPAELETEQQWEEQLIETRREKIRDFQIKQNRESMDFRYADEEAPDELPTAVAAEEEPAPTEEKRSAFTGDFTDFEQVADVRAELDHRYRMGRFRLLLAMAAVFILACSEMGVAISGAPSIIAPLFMIFNCGLFGATVALLFPMILDGTTALLHKKPNADSLPTLVAAVVALHALLQWFHLSAVEAGEAPLFTAVAGVFLILCAVGRQCRASRILRNFSVVGDADSEKYAAAIIQDEYTAMEIGRRAVAAGVPRIAYFRPVSFLDDFLANSYMDDRFDTVLGRVIPVAGGAAVVVGIVAGAVAGSVWTALSALTVTFAVALPIASLALNFHLLYECKRLLDTGNMLCSYAAAERVGNVDGVTLDVSDVYLQSSVALHGIRTFGDARIDEVITDAGAVAVRTDGPLAGMFLRIIEDKTEILPPVENLVFEQDMGFSGWVGGRRVLVGNRKLLENHGIFTPSSDYERRYKKGGKELVYLSVAGALSAMFIISYVTDPMVKEALTRLQNAKVSLLIRSVDPNITEDSLCAGFHLDEYYVELMNASAGRLYQHLRRDETDRVSAGAASNGTVAGISQLITACKRLYRRGNFTMLLQLICCLVGVIAAFGAAVSGGALSALFAVFFLGITSGISLLLPFIRR